MVWVALSHPSEPQSILLQIDVTGLGLGFSDKMPQVGASEATGGAILFLTLLEVSVPKKWSHLVLQSPHHPQESCRKNPVQGRARPSITRIPSILPKFFSFFNTLCPFPQVKGKDMISTIKKKKKKDVQQYV